MKLKRIYFINGLSKIGRAVPEKHKPLIPTIIYWQYSLGNYNVVTFKFQFWTWWVKVGINWLS